MVVINHTLPPSIEENLIVHSKQSLHSMQLVMEKFPNINGIGAIYSHHMEGLTDGICIVIKFQENQLSNEEKQLLEKLGVVFGVVEIDRVNLDPEDIAELEVI